MNAFWQIAPPYNGLNGQRSEPKATTNRNEMAADVKSSLVALNSTSSGSGFQLGAWSGSEAVFHMVPVLINNLNSHTSPSGHNGSTSGSSPPSAILSHDASGPPQIVVPLEGPSSANHLMREKRHKCEFCGKRFTHRHHLKTHEKTHTNELEHACSFCEKRFNRKDVLQVHERSHTGEKPYKCRFCEEVFSDCRMRTRHESRCHPNKQYICEQCGEIFGLDRRQFSSHMKKTHRSAVYKCEFCSLTFGSLHGMQDHIVKYHQVKEDRIEVIAEEVHIETPDIVVTIQDPETPPTPRRPHHNYHHNRNPNQMSQQQLHMQQLHQDQRVQQRMHIAEQHRDHQIQRQNIRNQQLIQRQQMSGVTLPFKCTFCTRGFNRKDCWKKHERSHTGEKPYRCRFCMDMFACTTARARHECKVHQGEKYYCEECKQEFPSKQMYNSHMKGSHPDESQQRCSLCPKSFKESAELERHVQAMHSGHDERLMRACSSLLGSQVKDESMLNAKESARHFIAPQVLEDDDHEEDIYDR